MSRTALALCLSAGLLTSCGAGREVTALSLEIPFLAQINPCTLAANLGQNMRAILEIGGHEPCPLTINSADLSARGECERITIGIVRPIGLGYWLPNPVQTTELVPLAFVIGWVNLEKEALEAGATSVTAVLDPSDPNVVQVDSDSELAALPTDTDCLPLTDPDELESCDAQVYFKEAMVADGVHFDFEPGGVGDGISNIREACDGTLFQ